MKIVDRKTFLELPEETVYAKCAPHWFGALSIKGETYRNSAGEGIDWQYVNLNDSVDANDSGERADIIISAHEKGTTFRQDYDCYSRDGCFDQDQLFAVWEPDDVEQLIERLQRCVKP